MTDYKTIEKICWDLAIDIWKTSNNKINGETVEFCQFEKRQIDNLIERICIKNGVF